MRILDRYILTELAGPFVFGIAAFSSIFVGTDSLFKMAKFVTEYGASLWTVIKLFAFNLPSIIVLTFPMSVLLASLLTFGRLSGSSEIVAMRNGGLSFGRIAAPVFIAAFVISIVAVVMNEAVVPAANTAYSDTVRELKNQDKLPKTQDHIIIKDIKNGQLDKLMYARQFNHDTGAMYDVAVQQFENGRLVSIIQAKQAVWSGDRWTMEDGMLYKVSPEGGLQHDLRFTRQVLPIERTPEQVSWEQKNLDDMSIRELKTMIQIRKSEYGNSNEMEVKLHQRIAIPLSSMIFAFVGAPLGLQPQRSSSAIGLGLSLVIIFVYYGMLTFFGSLGQGGAIDPVLGAWLPDIVALVLGIFLVLRARR